MNTFILTLLVIALSGSSISAYAGNQSVLMTDNVVASTVIGDGIFAPEELYSKRTAYKNSLLSPELVQHGVDKQSNSDRGNDVLLMLLALAGLIALQLRRKHKALPHRQLMLHGKSAFDLVAESRVAQPSLKLDLQS